MLVVLWIFAWPCEAGKHSAFDRSVHQRLSPRPPRLLELTGRSSCHPHMAVIDPPRICTTVSTAYGGVPCRCRPVSRRAQHVSVVSLPLHTLTALGGSQHRLFHDCVLPKPQSVRHTGESSAAGTDSEGIQNGTNGVDSLASSLVLSVCHAVSGQQGPRILTLETKARPSRYGTRMLGSPTWNL